ncbi:YdhK family protein [Corynebacterium genitalium ATCC 33030]|nr:YdhK family protein [Corynebacterium genitalium]UUA90391.1 YdhK family protein [Corynebacterium genitalium ATCC 33030]
MTTRKTMAIATVAVTGLFAATACSSENTEVPQTPETTVQEETSAEQNHEHGDDASGHEGHEHAEDGGPAPEGMTEAADPTYPVGTEVILAADHMPGMDGAKATIVGAFDGTYTYAISYDPTDGGERVTNHKWVVQQELEDAGEERLADGTEKVVTAEHMKGMKGATATIDSSTDETVYMVDVEADGMTMKNHKWVVESEIKPAN